MPREVPWSGGTGRGYTSMGSTLQRGCTGRKRHPPAIVRGGRLLATILLAAVSWSGSFAGAAEPRPRVLCLHSYHKSAWTDQLVKGYESVLGRRHRVDFFVAYMDTKQNHSAEYLDRLRELYRAKYQNAHFDLLLVSGDNAFDFALRDQGEIFHDAPIVFCSVNDYQPALRRDHTNITGVVETGDFADTLAVAFRVRPAARTVYAVCDGTDTCRVNLANLREAVGARDPPVALEAFRDLSAGELGARLAALPADSFVFFLSFWQDGGGRQVSTQELGEILAHSSVPVFGRSEWMLGHGMVGGKCVSGYHQGVAAAQLAARILDGTPPAQLPVVTESLNKYMFDYEQLVRFGIPESELPAGSLVINRPASFYHDYKNLVLSTLAIFLILLALIVSLSINIARREKAEEALRSTDRFLRTVINHAPIMLWAVNRDGVFTFSQGLGMRALGLRPDEVVGHSAREVYGEVPEIIDSIRSALAGETVTRAVTVRGVHYEAHFTPLRDAAGAVNGAIGLATDITRRVAAEEGRRRLATAVEQAAEAIVVTDSNGVIEYVNPAFTQITGYASEEAVGKTPRILRSGRHGAEFYRQMWRTIKGGAVWAGRFTNRRKDGTQIEEEATISPLLDAQDRVIGFVAVQRDVSAQVAMEQQLRQAQKMEAIGQLAGGLAHDFNNLLSPIMGYAGLLLMSATPEDESYEPLTQIEGAAERARNLTRQLLTFGRRQAMDVRTFDLAATVADVEKMLRSTIREDIRIEIETGDEPGQVRGDAAQVEHVLMNLALNAQDAMPGGGVLRIGTANAELDESYARTHPGAEPGRYIQLTVADTGFGMDAHTLEHAFEPFFTTKAKGSGTGLGLATVYGIVRQHGGYIEIASEVDRGTTFTVYLPRSDGPADDSADTAGRPVVSGGSETVMVVEDDETVRRMACAILGVNGYRTVSASCGQECLDRLADFREPLHLLLTDVIMPDMSGRELYELLRHPRPELRVLFMSGHARSVIAHHGVLEKGLFFLEKPFTVESLTRKVREALDANGDEGTEADPG